MQLNQGLQYGDVITYAPVSIEFAKSSGSNKPSTKHRPCIVFAKDNGGVFTVIPTVSSKPEVEDKYVSTSETILAILLPLSICRSI